MEFINWLTTFGIGAFLVGGIGYQFYRISTSSDTSTVTRGLFIQNIINCFLWVALFGLFVVFASFLADRAHWFDFPNCNRNSGCTLYGVQLSPLHVYAASATRLVPFVLPIFISSLRIGLNVAADVLLYILPEHNSFSIRSKSRDRLALF